MSAIPYWSFILSRINKYLESHIWETVGGGHQCGHCEFSLILNISLIQWCLVLLFKEIERPFAECCTTSPRTVLEKVNMKWIWTHTNIPNHHSKCLRQPFEYQREFPRILWWFSLNAQWILKCHSYHYVAFLISYWPNKKADWKKKRCYDRTAVWDRNALTSLTNIGSRRHIRTRVNAFLKWRIPSSNSWQAWRHNTSMRCREGRSEEVCGNRRAASKDRHQGVHQTPLTNQLQDKPNRECKVWDCGVSDVLRRW